jgi:hypothetical protein
MRVRVIDGGRAFLLAALMVAAFGSAAGARAQGQAGAAGLPSEMPAQVQRVTSSCTP